VFRLVLVLLLLALPVAAQTRVETHSPLGVKVSVPRRYAPMPVSPDETNVRLRWLGEENRAGLRPDLYLIELEHTPDAEPLPEPPPVNSLERFLARGFRPWAIAETKDQAPSEGWSVREHRLERRLDGQSKSRPGLEVNFPWAAVAIERRLGAKSWIVLGLCDSEDLEKELKGWRSLATKLAVFEPTAAAEEKKWARYYQFHPEFKHGELRTQLRARLLDGWKWHDTPNFVYLASTDKAALMRDVQKKLEGIRKHFLELFPPVGEITAVSTVRVCQDKDEYLEYGGPPRSAGYWNPLAKELVFFENGKEDTRIVLYHEAFHQYVYYAVGEVNPHPWFNEGYGDYFSGAEFNTHGDVLRIRPNPWRVEAIRALLDRCPPWKELLRMDQAAFMGQAEVHYPMSWSIVYFLEESKEAAAEPAWANILPTYYRTLKQAFTRERTRLQGEGLAGNAGALKQASETAREEAVARAFEGVELAPLERAWVGFVRTLKPVK